MHHEASIGLTCAGIPRFQRCRAARALRKPSAYPCQQWCLLLDLKHVWPRTTAELHEWRKVARTAASSFSSSSWAGRQELSAVLKNNKRARTGAQAHRRADGQTGGTAGSRAVWPLQRRFSVHVSLKQTADEHFSVQGKGAHFLKHQVWWSGCWNLHVGGENLLVSAFLLSIDG